MSVGEPGAEEQIHHRGRVSNLARRYARVVDDEKRPEKEREAALLYSVAESRLDGDPEDLEETLEVAERSRALFQDLGDTLGVAHVRRLIAHARRLQAATKAVSLAQEEVPGFAAKPTEVLARVGLASWEAEDALDSLRTKEEDAAARLLEVAEGHLCADRPGEARAAAAEALPLFRQLGDLCSAADALRVMISALFVEEGEVAAEQRARQELERFMDTENAYGEAAMLLSLTDLNRTRGSQKCQEALGTGIEALEIFQELGHKAMEASALLALAKVYTEQGNGKEAMRAASDSVLIFRELGDPEGEGKALQGMALAYRFFGKLDDALRWARLATVLVRETGHRRLEVVMLSLTAQILGEKNDYGGMQHYAQGAMEIAGSSNFYREESEALALVVQAHISSGQLEQVLAVAEQALQRFQALQYSRGQAAALDLLAQGHLSRGDVDRALGAANGALALIRELGDRSWESRVLHRLSSAELSGKRFEEAGKSANDAISLMREVGDNEGEVAARLHTLVQVHTQNHEWEQALNVLSQALELVRDAGDREQEAYALCTTASVHLQLGTLDKAGDCAAMARIISAEFGDTGVSIQALHILSQVNQAKGDHKQAAREAEEALALLRNERHRNRKEELALLLHLNQVHHYEVLRFRREGGIQESRFYTDLVARVDRGATAAHKAAVELGDKAALAIAKFRFAQAALLCGRFLEAVALNDTAMELFREVDDRLSEGNCILVKSQVFQALGEFQQALELAQTAQAIGQSCKDQSLESEATSQIQVLTKELGLSDLCEEAW